MIVTSEQILSFIEREGAINCYPLVEFGWQSIVDRLMSEGFVEPKRNGHETLYDITEAGRRKLRDMKAMS